MSGYTTIIADECVTPGCIYQNAPEDLEMCVETSELEARFTHGYPVATCTGCDYPVLVLTKPCTRPVHHKLPKGRNS